MEELKVMETMETNEAVADTYTECEAEQPKIDEVKETADTNEPAPKQDNQIKNMVIGGVAVAVIGGVLTPIANELATDIIKGGKAVVKWAVGEIKGAHEKRKEKKAAKKAAKVEKNKKDFEKETKKK